MSVTVDTPSRRGGRPPRRSGEGPGYGEVRGGGHRGPPDRGQFDDRSGTHAAYVFGHADVIRLSSPRSACASSNEIRRAAPEITGEIRCGTVDSKVLLTVYSRLTIDWNKRERYSRSVLIIRARGKANPAIASGSAWSKCGTVGSGITFTATVAYPTASATTV